jgi:integrase
MVRGVGIEPTIPNHPLTNAKIKRIVTFLVALTDVVLLVLLLGMASLRKRPGSKKWVCCYTRPDGSRAQRSTGKTKRDEAMEICLQWEVSADQARQGNFTEAQARKVISDIAQRSGMGAIEFATTQQFLTDWLTSKEATKSKGTTIRYRYVVEEFIKFLGKRAATNLGNVRPSDISAFRDEQVKDGKSNGTANMVIKTLRIPLNMARRQGLILSNPADAVDLLSADQQNRTTFTRTQIAALLKAADLEWQGMILLGVCHGLRLGDAVSLTWENFNPERRSLILRPQKTKRVNANAEEYPLHPDVADYIATLPIHNSNPKAPLFPTLSKRKSGGRTGLSETFRKLMHKAGIVTEGEKLDRKEGKGRRFFELGYHSFRHTAISEQANQGVAKEVRMKLSGHKSNVHERYTHHDLEALRKQIEKVPSFVKPEHESQQSEM